jgi:WD40 repeat protein/tRNA A-37 threonylcarbamoyl transferase component Bud32
MTTASTDRNLLFGILALQMDFISRDALVRAMNAWLLEKTKSLGQILVEQRVLSGERRALLETLVGEHLKQHGDDPHQSLAAVNAADPVRQELQQLADPDLHASLARLSTLPPDKTGSWATTAPSVGAPTSSGRRFHILRPHARGGLGEVFVARDEELHREVALKEIQDRLADDPGSRSRFVREAEITGGLEHPGIVPVYGLGTYADGRPYYAMRFIRGDSLKDAIERFHKADEGPRDPGERTLALRQLLRRFVDVCNAVAYAHSRGVLHRDLKPGNVMLGQFGETLVVDWGLARAGAAEPDGRAAGEAPLVPQSAAAATVAGQVVGTPGYMSPEQATGRLDLLGPASDVYSLGATLYCLLTGQPPFTDTDLGVLLQKVQGGDFPRPRQIKAAVPAGLEAVCLKALALHPEDRYGSPRALADDVEHWLADEPVSAYREPWWARVGRWGRQHKGPVGTAAAVAAVLLTAAVAWGLVSAADRQKAAEQERADREHATALEMDRLRGLAEEQRGLAEQQRAMVGRFLYASDMNRAQAAWRETQIADMLDILQRHSPEYHPGADRRGFEWFYLWHLCHSELVSVPGGSAVAFSPDGTRTASPDGQVVKVWDAQTGKGLLTLKGHAGPVWSVAYSPDGKLIASGSRDGTAKVWDAQTGLEVLTFQGQAGDVLGVAFSPDGRLLAAAGAGTAINGPGAVKLWDAQTARPILALTAATGPVQGVAFSPDGKRLAGATGTEVKVWDAQTGKDVLTLKGHTGPVRRVAFSPDGKRLASASDSPGHQVKVWAVQNGAELLSLNKHTGGVLDVAFSRDGKRLASASADRTVKVCDAETGHDLLTLKGHIGRVEGVAFNPDGQRLASAGSDGRVKMWDVTREQEAFVFRGHADAVTCVAFGPGGKVVVSGGGDRRVRVWEAATGRELNVLQGHSGAIFGVACSPDGKHLASAGGEGAVKVWETASGREVFSLTGHTGIVYGVAFSPDGKRIASAGQDRTVKVWDAERGGEILSLAGHTGAVKGVAFSPDGKQIASGSDDQTVKVWDAQSGEPVRDLKGHTAFVNSVAFSPDGSRLASGSNDRTVKVWDVAAGRQLLSWRAHLGFVTGVAFSPDGQRLASAGSGEPGGLTAAGEGKVWDAVTGVETLALRGHAGGLRGVAFRPDGQRLASASEDNTVRVWEAPRGP